VPRRGSLKRRLRSLSAREQEGRRDLGVVVLEMFRRDHLDTAALSERAAELASISHELDDLHRELGEPPPPRKPTMPAVTLPPAGSPPGPVPTAETAPNMPRAPVSPPPAAAAAGGSVDQLTTQLEGAEARVQAAAELARREAEDAATAEILALEQDLEREQERAAQALEEGQRRLREAEERVREIEEDRARKEAEIRGAAAEWLRGQARAMRHEAESQIQTEGVESVVATRIEELERERDGLKKALAEMTERSNQANARAQEAAGAKRLADQTAHLEEQLRMAREEADGRVREAEVRARAEAEQAKADALEAAEKRLTEIDARAQAASERVEAAERKLGEETARLRREAEQRVAAEAEKVKAEAKRGEEERVPEREGAEAVLKARAEADEARAEAERAEAAAAHLSERESALQRERDEAATRAGALERRVGGLEARAEAAERRAAELSAAPGRAPVEETESRLRADEGRIGSQPDPEAEGPEVAEPAPVAVVAPGDRLDLNAATFEQLREIGMSLTQSNRVLAYRERMGGYRSVDDLDAVPGFPRNFLNGLKAKLRA
jgi:DNA uptake protein ComE-like DNA-binding protein